MYKRQWCSQTWAHLAWPKYYHPYLVLFNSSFTQRKRLSPVAWYGTPWYL